MRITNRMMVNNSLSNLQINKKQMNKIETQMSTQKKINKPSEDPIVAIRALRLRSSLDQVTQYLDKNIKDADSWLKSTQSSLDEANSVLVKLYDYCTQGSTDSYSSSERNTLADSLNQLKNTFYDQGNVDYSGRYIFTGYNTDKTLTYQSDEDAEGVNYTISQNFTRDDLSLKTIYTNAYSNDDVINLNVKTDASGNVVTPNVTTTYRLRTGYSEVKSAGFTINYGNTDIAVSEDGKTAKVTTYQLDANGDKVKDASGNPVVLATTDVTADADGKFSVTASDGSTVVLGTTTDSNYNPDDNEIIFNASTGEILLGQNTYKNIYESNEFSITYSKDNFKKGDLNPIMYYDCVDNNTGIEYKKKDEDINYNINFSQEIKINTEAKDAFNIYLGRDIDDLITSVQNAIDVENQISKVKEMQKLDQYKDSASQKKLSQMLEGLEKQKDLTKDNMTKTFEKGISKMQGYQSEVAIAKADVGNRLTRLDLNKTRLTEQKTNFKSLKSENEDIDLEDVTINYLSAQLVYNAALSAAGKTVQQTLLDFL